MPKAWEFYIKGRDLFSRLGNLPAIASNDENLAEIASKSNDQKTALKLLEEVLEINREICDISSLARCTGNMSFVYAEQENWKETQKLFVRSHDLHLQQENMTDFTKYCKSLGNIAWNKKNFQIARRYLLQGFEIAESAGDDAMVREFKSHLAKIEELGGV